MDKILETKRLVLRKFSLLDLEDLSKLYQDVKAAKYTRISKGLNQYETEARLKEIILPHYQKYGFGRWAILNKKDKKFVGLAGLVFQDEYQAVDLGYWINRRYWGKGIASEISKSILDYGLNTLNLEKIIAIVACENKASVKILEKIGMKKIEKTICGGYNSLLFEIRKEKTKTQ